jgi:lipopolysaccharide biosynthesis glycosyltransferase
MRVPVVFSVDEAFALPLAVSVASLVRSASKEDDLEIHVLGQGISDADRRMIESAAAGVAPLEWHAIGAEQFADLPSAHLSPAAYYRLLIPTLLDAERAVYLDSDVLVRAPVAPLMSIPLDGRPAAAARNLTVPFLASRQGLTGWDQLGLDPAAPYFNSGVLVIDLEQWRNDEVTEHAIDYVRRFEDGIRFADQDALNAALYNDWQELEPRWNQQPLLLDDWSGVHAILAPEAITQGRDDPAIVHFVGPIKPWHRDCDRPWTQAWQALARELQPGWEPERRQSRPAELTRRLKRAAHVLLRGG